MGGFKIGRRPKYLQHFFIFLPEKLLVKEIDKINLSLWKIILAVYSITGNNIS